MTSRRASTLVLVALAIGVAVAEPASGGGSAHAVAAAADSRAAVVVDLGDGQVRTACVVFAEESVTGIDLLRAAQMNPVVRAYGEGGAVCKLCGQGCSPGSDCLTCQAPNYWQYWRADRQQARFEYSQAGAGSTQVQDGDVEGWRWGSDKTAPPFRTVDSICDAGPVYRAQAGRAATAPTTTAAAPTTSTPPTTSSSVVAAAPPAPPREAGPGVTSGNAPPPAVVSTTAMPPASPSTAPAAGSAQAPALAAPARGTADKSRSSWPGLAAVTLLLGGLGGWTIRIRSRNAKLQ